MTLQDYLWIGGLILLLLILGWWLFFRTKPVVRREFPTRWRRTLRDKVSFYHRLGKADRGRFEQSVMQFLDEVEITGIGIQVNDTDRLLVAASAVTFK